MFNRKIVRPLTVAAAAFAVLGFVPSAYAAPASASSHAVQPRSADGCSGYTEKVCITISGSGLHVNYIRGDVFETFGGGINDQGYLTISGPSGVIATGSYGPWPGEGDRTVDWFPTTNTVPAGNYCVTGYKNGKRFDGACANVHA